MPICSFVQWMYPSGGGEENVESAALGIIILWTTWYIGFLWCCLISWFSYLRFVYERLHDYKLLKVPLYQESPYCNNWSLKNTVVK